MTLDPARQLVQQLVDALAKGGQATEDAALALGLLIERERVSRPAGSDDSLEHLFGAAVAAQRLTPLAIHEAVDALLARTRQEGLPPAIVIWALTKSFEPRIVPHLLPLLERVVDDPQHENLARQIVDGLSCYFDARAVAGLRTAAARGHGEAKAGAEHWLSMHGHREVPRADAALHSPSITHRIEGSIYRLQRRPGHRDVVVNDGDRGLRVIEPMSGTEIARAAFSTGYGQDRSIAAWCFRADGAMAMSFSASGSGALLSFTGEPSRDLTAPGRLPLDDLRYSWAADQPLFVQNGLEFWVLRFGEASSTFTALPAIQVRVQAPSWRKAIEDVPPLRSRVLRNEPDCSRMLAYVYETPPGELVALSWRPDEQTLRIPVRAYVPDIAYHDRRMFLLFDHEVQAINADGDVSDVFPVPDGFYFRALDTVAASTEGPAALVVAASSLNDDAESRLLIYPLASR
jgi:hypothetical protein